jgi:hypothetical protein
LNGGFFSIAGLIRRFHFGDGRDRRARQLREIGVFPTESLKSTGTTAQEFFEWPNLTSRLAMVVDDPMGAMMRFAAKEKRGWIDAS